MTLPSPASASALVVSAPGGASMVLPVLVADAGDTAARLTLEFFAARIANPNTRKAYGRAVWSFCGWCSRQGIALREIQATTVAAFLDGELASGKSVPTIKLTASGLRHWLDFLTERGVLPFNPALSVRTPRHVVRKGKTPIFEKPEGRALFASLEGGSLLDLRDRAMFAVMLYPPFTRVGAVVKMTVADFEDGKAPFLVLHEKGGLERREACHHKVAEYLRAYLDAAGSLREDRKAPLFQSAPRWSGALSGKALRESGVWEAVKRRCKDAGLSSKVTCHSFRAAGITYHREAGGELAETQRLAGHASPSTTAGYDHSTRKAEREEVERVQL